MTSGRGGGGRKATRSGAGPLNRQPSHGADPNRGWPG